MKTGSSGFKPNYEGEALSRRAKRFIHWEPGERKSAKRRFWKRQRREARLRARVEAAN